MKSPKTIGTQVVSALNQSSGSRAISIFVTFSFSDRVEPLKNSAATRFFRIAADTHPLSEHLVNGLEVFDLLNNMAQPGGNQTLHVLAGSAIVVLNPQESGDI